MITVVPATLITRSPRQTSCAVDGEAVVMSLEHHRFYALNDTASAVWNLTDAPRPVHEIVDDLVGRFDVGPVTCARDVCAVLGRMVDCGIVDAGATT